MNAKLTRADALLALVIGGFALALYGRTTRWAYWER